MGEKFTLSVKNLCKWVGGKKQLLKEIIPALPAGFLKNTSVRYHEPFVGGGAVLFFLLEKGRRPTYISDSNSDLINCYKQVRDNLAKVILHLRQCAQYYEPAPVETFYSIRARFNAEKTRGKGDTAIQAARFIFLNKTDFNGLFRVNKSGEFNVGHGKFSSPPVICDEAHLGEVSKILQDVDITCRDFSESLKRMAPGDFGYIDPPYWPVSETANFTSFTPEGFTRQDQEDLAESCRVLTDQGVFLMVSNSDTPFTRRLYKGFNICKVEARRCVNSAGKKRGSVPELLMTNY